MVWFMFVAKLNQSTLFLCSSLMDVYLHGPQLIESAVRTTTTNFPLRQGIDRVGRGEGGVQPISFQYQPLLELTEGGRTFNVSASQIWNSLDIKKNSNCKINLDHSYFVTSLYLFVSFKILFCILDFILYLTVTY